MDLLEMLKREPMSNKWPIATIDLLDDLGKDEKVYQQENARSNVPKTRTQANIKAVVRKEKAKVPPPRKSIRRFYANRRILASVDVNKDTLEQAVKCIKTYNPLLPFSLSASMGSFVFNVPTSFLDHLLYRKQDME